MVYICEIARTVEKEFLIGQIEVPHTMARTQFGKYSIMMTFIGNLENRRLNKYQLDIFLTTRCNYLIQRIYLVIICF